MPRTKLRSKELQAAMCINIILRQEKIGSIANKMLSLFGKIQNHTKILFKKDEKLVIKN